METSGLSICLGTKSGRDKKMVVLIFQCLSRRDFIRYKNASMASLSF